MRSQAQPETPKSSQLAQSVRGSIWRMTAKGGLNGECLHRTFAYGLEACERCPSLERLHGTWIDREGCRQIDGVRQHRPRGGRVDGI